MLNRTFIACTADNPTKCPNLTMIHGWAAENVVWQEWATQYLAPHFNLYLIELPGFGKSPEFKHLADEDINQAWLDALAEQLPEKSHLLGWSLGGLLAQQLTLTYPEKVQSLICLASTPRFTQNDHWKWAVNPPLLADFIMAISREVSRVLKQFWTLQLQGSTNARTLIKHFTRQMHDRTPPTLQGLLQGLSLLRDIDNRQHLAEIDQPTLWLLGEHDPLVPQQLITELSRLQKHSHIEIILGASHMPFFSHPEPTAQVLINFINQHSAPAQ